MQFMAENAASVPMVFCRAQKSCYDPDINLCNNLKFNYMKSSQNHFEFEKQFSSAFDFYKSQLVLRLLNRKIRLEDLIYGPDDPETVVGFCDRHHIEITGLDVKKQTSKGGKELTDEQVAALLKEKTGITCDGQIISVDVIDRHLGVNAHFFCVKDKNKGSDAKIIPSGEINKFLNGSGLTYLGHSGIPLAGNDGGGFIQDENMALCSTQLQISENLNLYFEDIDFIRKPRHANNNQWVLASEEIKNYWKNYFSTPVLKVSHECLKEELGFTGDQLREIKEFEFLLNSEFVRYVLQANDDLIQDGICLNCLSRDIWKGDRVACMHCDSEMVLFIDEDFPAGDEVVEEIRSFLKRLGVSLK